MRRLLFLAVLLGLVAPAPLRAQDRSVGRDLKDAGHDAAALVRAPFTASAADWQTVALLGAGFGALLLVDGPVHEWLRRNPESLVVRALDPFGEGSPVSLAGRTAQFLLPLSAALYTAGHVFGSDDLRAAGIGCATTNLTTTLTRSAVSLLVGRLRPRNDRGPFIFELLAFGDWDMRSFPGGHAANVMSCASFLNHRFDLGIAEPAIYATAAGVGLARVVDEAHWTSDSFAGMSYGYAVGRMMAQRSAARLAEREERSLQPVLSIGWRIHF